MTNVVTNATARIQVVPSTRVTIKVRTTRSLLCSNVRCSWWAQQDSNLWPQPCEGCALTN